MAPSSQLAAKVGAILTLLVALVTVISIADCFGGMRSLRPVQGLSFYDGLIRHKLL